MYTQRILPLFLALALCTTQVSAEESFFKNFFYITGSIAFAMVIGTAAGFLYSLVRSKVIIPDMLKESADRHRMMDDLLKIKLVTEGAACKFDLGKIGVSQASRDIISSVVR